MRLAAALVVALLSCPALAQEPIATTDPVMQSAVDGVIRPAVIGFAREASGLASSISALCAEPSATGLLIAADQFRQTVVAYGRIEPIQVGPLTEAGRAERVLYWPDPDGKAELDVGKLLAQQNPDATDVATLAGMSGAVQGLRALEIILFGPEAAALESSDGDFRCRFGLAAAQVLARVGQELASGWYSPDDISTRLLAPGPDRDDFRSREEATAALVGVLVDGLVRVREGRIEEFIGSSDASATPDKAVLFRSGMTMQLVAANLQVLRDLFNISGMGLRGAGSDPDLVARIEREFSDLNAAIAAVTLPVAEAVVDPQQRGALTEVIQRTEILQVMIGEQLAAALGVAPVSAPEEPALRS